MKRWVWLLLVCVGCASIDRDCASCGASNFGGDWIVLQYGFDGTPINCWQLRNVAIENEHATDGIYWQSSDGHLVHISGWYNRAQVTNGDFAGAARQLGINLASCSEGRYTKPTPPAEVNPFLPPEKKP